MTKNEEKKAEKAARDRAEERERRLERAYEAASYVLEEAAEDCRIKMEVAEAALEKYTAAIQKRLKKENKTSLMEKEGSPYRDWDRSQRRFRRFPELRQEEK